MVNAIIGHMAAHFRRHRFELGRPIFHGNADTHGLQHFKIIIAVAEGNGLLLTNTVILQNFLNPPSLAAVGWNHIHRPIPPAGDPCTGYSL